MSAAPRPATDSPGAVILHVAASRIRAAVGVGGYLPAGAVRALHPAFAGGAGERAIADASALCGMRADAEGDGVRFSDPASLRPEYPAQAEVAGPAWQPPASGLFGRRALVLTGAPVADATERLVSAIAARLGGTVRPGDLKADPSLAGVGPAERLRGLNALVARGVLRDASPDPAACEAWKAKCDAMLDLVSRSGKAHAPFAALRLGLSSPAEANLVGGYLCDLGLLRKEKGAYLAP